jgi:hypothetical protein
LRRQPPELREGCDNRAQKMSPAQCLRDRVVSYRILGHGAVATSPGNLS